MSQQPQQNSYNNNRISVTSSLISFFDNQSNQLRLAALDSSLQIAIWIPLTGDDGRKSYPETHRFTVTLTPQTAAVLERALVANIIPAYEEGRNCSILVYTNNKRSNTIEVIINSGKLYVRIGKDVDLNGVPTVTYTYEFSKGAYFKNFNAETGMNDATEVDGQFYIFAQSLSYYVRITCNGLAGHSNKMISAYANAYLQKQIHAIMGKVGATVGTTQNNYNKPVHGTGSNNTSYNQDMGASIPTNEIEDTDMMALL